MTENILNVVQKYIEDNILHEIKELNWELIPDLIKVCRHGKDCEVMQKNNFVSWFNKIYEQEQSDLLVEDCDGETVLEKIQNWLNRDVYYFELEAFEQE